MTGGKSGNNMMMIGGAIVVIIIIAIAAVLLTSTGSKTKAPQSTTIATTTAVNSTAGGTSTVAATNVNTTTVAQSGNSSFSSWAGQNISISTFSQDLGQETFAKLTSVNATYDFNISITENTNTTKLNGMLTRELYQNSSRTSTNLTYSGYNIQSISIYNSSSHMSYVCSSSGSSYSCFATNVNESVGQGNSAINYLESKGGTNTTATGYFNNIQVSTSSVNGQPCTLITGDLHVSTTSSSSNYVLNGMLNACVSTQNNLALKTSLVGATNLTSSGSTTHGNFNYTETWVRSGPAPTAAITALPGPVTTA